MIDKRIGIIGCGNMGEALLAGLIKNEAFANEDIIVSEKQEKRSEILKNKYPQITFVENNEFLIKDTSIIMLAVKPQDIESVLKQISAFLNDSHMLISIAAGIKISSIEKMLEKTIPIIRVMPNLPALIGEGISAYCASRIVSEENEKIAEEIFASAGRVIKIEEEKMDAVTAVSGSGPAYIFYMLEAMTKAGEKLGLAKEQAGTLSLQTALGSLRMIEKGEDPSALREKVTSPKGTTEAALKVLKEKEWEKILIEAIEKAKQRSKELSE